MEDGVRLLIVDGACQSCFWFAMGWFLMMVVWVEGSRADGAGDN